MRLGDQHAGRPGEASELLEVGPQSLGSTVPEENVPATSDEYGWSAISRLVRRTISPVPLSPPLPELATLLFGWASPGLATWLFSPASLELAIMLFSPASLELAILLFGWASPGLATLLSGLASLELAPRCSVRSRWSW